MIKQKYKILVITPIKHIVGVKKILETIGSVTYKENPSYNEIKKTIKNFDAIYTNPNKSNVIIDKDLINSAKNLKVICTASTGTNHIDMNYANQIGVHVINLKNERQVINKISSTAEHALALTLSSLRNIISSSESVKKGKWDYTSYIGRQLNHLKIGIIGYGRLGKFYSRYMQSFKSKIIVFDPYKKVNSRLITQTNNINYLFKNSDIISIHVHFNNETNEMINKKSLALMKEDVIIVNTSRGEIVHESDLIDFIKKNKKAKYATDVLSNEVSNKKNNLLRRFSKKNNQVLITPHIGGMTNEAQKIAFSFVAKKLKYYFKYQLKSNKRKIH